MRCNRNCNTCSQYWSTERDQFFSTTVPNCTSHNQHFKRWTHCMTKFCLICRIHLTSCQLKTISWSISTSFCWENASTTSKKMLLQPQPEHVFPLFGKIILGAGIKRCLEDGCSLFTDPGLQLQHFRPLATQLTSDWPHNPDWLWPSLLLLVLNSVVFIHSQFVSQVWSRGSSLSAASSLFSPKWWVFPPIPGLGPVLVLLNT